MEITKKRLLKNRIFYGLGAVGPTIFDTFISSFLTLFVTDVLKLDALFFASLLIGPKIFDIVIDLFVMYFVGKTKSRFGKYRPWLINMAAIVGSLLVIFSSPYFNIANSGLLVIIVIAYFFSDSLCSSFYWIPYIAMPGVMTEDSNELVNISSSKTIFDYVFSILVSAATMPLLMAFGSYKNPQGWIIAAAIFGGISLICSLLCFAFIKTNRDLETKTTRDYSAKDVVKDYGHVITNKGFLVIVCLLFLGYFSMYINSSVSYYFYIYNLGIENIIGYISLVAAAVTVIVSIFTNKIQKRIGQKNTLLLSICCLIASAITTMFTYNVATVVIGGCIMVTGNTLFLTIIFSLWPKVAKNLDNHKMKTPLNSTIGLSNIFGNLGILVGNTLGAAIISWSKYNPDIQTQDSYTLSMFRYCCPAILIGILIIMGLVIIFGFKNSQYNSNLENN